MKKTMSLNLTEQEMEALEQMAESKDLSKTAVLRQALRLYQAVNVRLAAGERLVFESDGDKKKLEVVLL